MHGEPKEIYTSVSAARCKEWKLKKGINGCLGQERDVIEGRVGMQFQIGSEYESGSLCRTLTDR